MNKIPSNEILEPASGREEVVTRFLEQTPDYFLRHPELLAALAIPHPEAGRAVSLVERQVRVLREQNESMSRQLRELIANARDNDLLAERLQRFALAITEAAALDDLIDTACDMLRQEFGLDGVALRITGSPRPEAARAEFVDDDAVLDRLLTDVSERNGQPLCGFAQEPEVLASLFGSASVTIRSTVVLALHHRGLRGVLVLGSQDAQRFRPDMGTLYLVRLGDLLMAGIGRHLTIARE